MLKRSFRRFRYTECDDFAVYLSEMAKDGWHFKGWKFGLVFEQGEPKEIEYSVEVFTKASDMDAKPDANTEEFAEYCEAAGWEFVDATQKFCVFRKKSEDSMDIVTVDERVENAGKAAIKSAIVEFTSFLIIIAINFGDLLDGSNYSIYFDNLRMLAPVIMFTYTAVLLGKLIKSVYWYLSKKKQIKCGQKIYIGIGEEKQKIRQLIGKIAAAIYVVMLLAIIYMADGSEVSVAMILFVLALFGCISFLEYIRPTRGERVVAAFAIAIFLSVVLVAYLFSLPDSEEQGCKDKNAAPLIQEDYKEMHFPFDEIFVQNEKSIFGTLDAYDVAYTKFDENGEECDLDNITYTIIQSDHQWLLNHIYNGMTEEAVAQDESKEWWGTQDAYYEERWWPTYYIRYEDKIFRFWGERALTKEQANIICEKLNLGQVN